MGGRRAGSDFGSGLGCQVLCICAACLFIYQTLDAIDGKQVRAAAVEITHHMTCWPRLAHLYWHLRGCGVPGPSHRHVVSPGPALRPRL